MTYRVGRHYGIHVYDDDRPVATFHNADEAARFVEVVNSHPVPVPASPRQGSGGDCRCGGAGLTDPHHRSTTGCLHADPHDQKAGTS